MPVSTLQQVHNIVLILCSNQNDDVVHWPYIFFHLLYIITKIPTHSLAYMRYFSWLIFILTNEIVSFNAADAKQRRVRFFNSILFTLSFTLRHKMT